MKNYFAIPIEGLNSLSFGYQFFWNQEMNKSKFIKWIRKAKNIEWRMWYYADLVELIEYSYLLPDRCEWLLESYKLSSSRKMNYDFEDVKTNEKILKQMSRLRVIKLKVDSNIKDKEFSFIKQMLKLPLVKIHLNEILLKLSTLTDCIQILDILQEFSRVRTIELHYSSNDVLSEWEDPILPKVIIKYKKSIKSAKEIKI